jgi:hypothetical protein
MVNFFYNDTFYESIEDFMEDQEIDEENIEDQPDFIKVHEAKLEPVFELSSDWIGERIDEDRFSENGDEVDKIKKVLDQIDFKKINSEIPKLWYSIGRKLEISKVDLCEALK